MKYSILINQAGIVKNGFSETTNFVDWVFLDYITWSFFSKNGKRITFDGKKFVWLNYNALIRNLPLIKIKQKPAITARIEHLHSEGLIETFRDVEHTLYVRPTDITISISLQKYPPVRENVAGGVHQNETAQYNNNINNNSLSKDKECNRSCNDNIKRLNNELDIDRSVFSYWNGLNIVYHQPTPSNYPPLHFLRTIRATRKRYKDSIQRIMDGMSTYAELYRQGKVTKVGLTEFLKWHLDKYIHPELTDEDEKVLRSFLIQLSKADSENWIYEQLKNNKILQVLDRHYKEIFFKGNPGNLFDRWRFIAKVWKEKWRNIANT